MHSRNKVPGNLVNRSGAKKLIALSTIFVSILLKKMRADLEYEDFVKMNNFIDITSSDNVQGRGRGESLSYNIICMTLKAKKAQ